MDVREVDSSEGEELWVEWFCNLDGNEMLCEVDRSYIEDGFNLYGLRQYVPNFQNVLDIILDNSVDDNLDPMMAQAAYLLYGLIHARFITTSRGLEVMYKKYRTGDFGRCPRMLCKDQFVVPCGIYDHPSKEKVKVYCPKCGQVYGVPTNPGEQGLDGSFFGTTFPHLFFLTFNRLIPEPCTETYIPRVFGFKIHPSAKCARQPVSQMPTGPPAPTTLKRGRVHMDFLVQHRSKRSKRVSGSRSRSKRAHGPNVSPATGDSNDHSNSSELTAPDRINLDALTPSHPHGSAHAHAAALSAEVLRVGMEPGPPPPVPVQFSTSLGAPPPVPGAFLATSRPLQSQQQWIAKDQHQLL
mmetsp:Transcript_2727/g.3884  ORF Transcript_2727/g.3884 Transcript_2727/m.3884 type:complete len:354 (+) Transcript_2727:133-1194(+)|eukprot:CAMPEP_0117760640 /NCGR_PEP_ID=MMETSP0947-20121206/16756_1 /TAXON_ID=44440 /ORGANISM="Chattonella subsalsa, Strain CCMP2191" /LENGTH=353 /DNA_ID=CAMNT_0005581381 /DNA_START=107 /DNA_END=1168 /DNA_ORIENTATION=+